MKTHHQYLSNSIRGDLSISVAFIFDTKVRRASYDDALLREGQQDAKIDKVLDDLRSVRLKRN